MLIVAISLAEAYPRLLVIDDGQIEGIRRVLLLEFLDRAMQILFLHSSTTNEGQSR